MKGADLSTGGWGTITNFTTSSREDGTYALAGLPAEEISLRVSKDKVGKTTFTIRGNPGRASATTSS